MKPPRFTRPVLAAVLAVLLIVGVLTVTTSSANVNRVHVVGYFANSNGIFTGDEVRILGVPVGKIEKIEAEPQRVKISFWYDQKFQVPADAKAVVLSPSIVSVRAIQLTPAYTGGPEMRDKSVIPLDRTAVPVEFDDFKVQLQRLTETLQPTQPGGVSTLGALVNTAADNLRGQGANIRDTIIKLSQAFSVLGDHSDDLFTTVKNLSILVDALQSSQDLLRTLNQNLAAVTGLLSNDPNELGQAVADINAVVGDVKSFVADNRESLGTTSDKLASVSTTLVESLDDIKQVIHVGAPAFSNFLNIYQPAQGALTGNLATNIFSNPIQFICGAVQAASRLGAEQSAKLCVQYLAPIIKNRQINSLPLGENLFVGASARPNEITYSEDWMRPDYIPPPGGAGSGGALPAEAPVPGDSTAPPPASGPLPPAGAPFTNFGEPADPYHGDPPFVPALPDPGPPPPPPAAVQSADPGAGLPGLMVPAAGGS
ncbi:MAG: phospholipid/cholesterol/gamma-HCH transport system substrate-binding protein [Mycobacterium sp.]|jgi:phospholipid/cholesterol/gamma-HCH transport system substrate-binding protein|nr:phospholipid/cholesterol/gamma-HCH transport system substrate-binding protein [Mycobacterium sp.]